MKNLKQIIENIKTNKEIKDFYRPIEYAKECAKNNINFSDFIEGLKKIGVTDGRKQRRYINFNAKLNSTYDF